MSLTSETVVPGKRTAVPKDAARFLVVLALVLTALSYVNTLGFAFVYDDLPQIVNNPLVHSWEHAPRFFVEHVWTQGALQVAGNYYRPLFEMWLLVNYSIFGLHAWGWHLTSVAVHLGVVALAYLVCVRVTGDRLTAAIATAIFAVHPTHIESVAWVSGITDPLCALFCLAAMLAYVRAVEERSTGWFISAVGLYAAAMLSKETAIVLPALFFIYDWWVRRQRQIFESAKRLVPFAVAAAAYLTVRHFALRGLMHSGQYSLASIALTVPKATWFYIQHLFWPVNLSVFYDLGLVQHAGFRNFFLPLFGIVAFVAVVLWMCHRSRTAVFAACWMFLFLLPALVGLFVFIPEDLVHDRYLYLPTLGFALLLAVVIRNISDRSDLFGAPRRQAIVTLAITLALALGTVLQNVYWANDRALYAHGIDVAPNNILALDHLANEMFKRHQPNEAVALYERSVSVEPNQWQTRFVFGITLFELRDYGRAAEQLAKAATIAPENSEQYFYLGLSEMQLKHFADAERNLRKVLSMNPRRPGAHYAIAIALENQGRLAEAREALEAELQLGPNAAASAELQKVHQK